MTQVIEEVSVVEASSSRSENELDMITFSDSKEQNSGPPL